MPEHELSRASTTSGLPVAPALGPVLASAEVPLESRSVDARVVRMCAVSVVVALAAALVAQLLTALIGLVTNAVFYGRVSAGFVSPAGNALGLAVIAVPVAGAVVVGLMARFGSKAIRGHGIPEAMEQVLSNGSRIPPRITFLKPISAAISIGTGGPFGAEGPIIATGGALGSLVGQRLHTTAVERKTLLAAGAAAGMAATFGSPVAAVLLAVELLLFEFRPRTLIPVALAAVAATGLRIAFVGSDPIFPMPALTQPGSAALACYVLVGALVGVASVGVTRAVYAIEDAFERLPIHWMWWPALGAVVVGVAGYFAPRTLGVGYDNIEAIVGGKWTLGAVATLCAWKFLSWSIALGSGTSGGTLAPLFTIGGGAGAAAGAAIAALIPAAGIDVRIAALVGMAAMFAGASRASLASVVFAFETTRQPIGLLPLLGGCTAAYLISCLLMRNSIMTEKIARRGVRVVGEYAADVLEQFHVRDQAATPVISIRADDTVEEVHRWISTGAPGTTHQGYPVLDSHGLLAGVVTRRDLFHDEVDLRARVGSLVRRNPIVAFDDSSLREAVDQMVSADVGRLPVVTRDDPRRVVGILTRRDVLEAHRHRLEESTVVERTL